MIALYRDKLWGFIQRLMIERLNSIDGQKEWISREISLGKHSAGCPYRVCEANSANTASNTKGDTDTSLMPYSISCINGEPA